VSNGTTFAGLDRNPGPRWNHQRETRAGCCPSDSVGNDAALGQREVLRPTVGEPYADRSMEATGRRARIEEREDAIVRPPGACLSFDAVHRHAETMRCSDAVNDDAVGGRSRAGGHRRRRRGRRQRETRDDGAFALSS
jgi:hypothetical protein